MDKHSVFCAACGAPIQENARLCSYCGYPVQSQSTTSTQPNPPKANQAGPPLPAAQQPSAVQAVAAQPQGALSPSELVLLRGEAFLAPVKQGYPLPLANIKVDRAALVRMVVTAAVLSGEQAGACRLELQTPPSKGIFKSPPRVYIIPTGAVPVWPANCLEYALPGLLSAATPAAEHPTANEVITGWLKTQWPEPEEELLHLIQEGLCARGLMQRQAETKRSFFSTAQVIHYIPTAVLREMVHWQPVESLQALINRCRTQRPALWETLGADIHAGLWNSRVEYQV